MWATRFFGDMVANNDLNVYIIARISRIILTVPGWSLKMPAGYRTIPDRASADVIIYIRRPAPVRYVIMFNVVYLSMWGDKIREHRLCYDKRKRLGKTQSWDNLQGHADNSESNDFDSGY